MFGPSPLPFFIAAAAARWEGRALTLTASSHPLTPLALRAAMALTSMHSTSCVLAGFLPLNAFRHSPAHATALLPWSILLGPASSVGL